MCYVCTVQSDSKIVHHCSAISLALLDCIFADYKELVDMDVSITFSSFLPPCKFESAGNWVLRFRGCLSRFFIFWLLQFASCMRRQNPWAFFRKRWWYPMHLWRNVLEIHTIDGVHRDYRGRECVDFGSGLWRRLAASDTTRVIVKGSK